MVVGCDTRVLVHVPHITRYVAIQLGLCHPADDTHGTLQPLQRGKLESNNRTNEVPKLRIIFSISVILRHVLILDYAPNSLKFW